MFDELANKLMHVYKGKHLNSNSQSVIVDRLYYEIINSKNFYDDDE